MFKKDESVSKGLVILTSLLISGSLVDMSCSREVVIRRLMAAERPSVETRGTHVIGTLRPSARSAVSFLPREPHHQTLFPKLIKSHGISFLVGRKALGILPHSGAAQIT